MGGVGGGVAQEVVVDRHQAPPQPLHHGDESSLKCQISSNLDKKLKNTPGESVEKMQWLTMTVKRNHLVASKLRLKSKKLQYLFFK